MEFESEDKERRQTTVSVESSHTMRKYETFQLITTITPKEDGDGSHVIWTVKFENITNDLSHHAARRSVEFDVKSPEDELFKAFIDSLKGYGNFH